VSADEVSAAEDHLVAEMLRSVHRAGHLPGLMAEMTPEERELVEAADARHAARQRAAGRRGW